MPLLNILLALFVIGCGLTCLETSANPYTTVLGHPDKAESRINLSQSLNGIGWIVGPLVGGQFLFSGVNIAIPYGLGGYLRAFCGAGPVKDQVARPKERASCFRLSSRWH